MFKGFGENTRHIYSRIFGRSERRRRSMSLGSDWSYSGELGPENWHKNFPVAAGENQSPINIDTHDVLYDPYLGDINFYGYHSNDEFLNYRLRNTGFAVKVDLHGDMHILEDDKRYEAYSLVFHWGGDDDKGSEHTIDRKKFPLEVQIMHRNVKYGIEDEEVFYKLDGIKALACFAEIGEEDHPGLGNITDNLERIKYKGQETDIKAFPLASLLPLEIKKYYIYSGSLTQPPCNECVNWIVLQDPIKISRQQLEKFRSLKKVDATAIEQEDLVDNFRPVQTIHKRRVTATLQLQDTFELQI